ncbi:uncharacterized protein LOC110974170 [Acanthaster planci]|uniref:Uncharacterized protein LOC110974170 n=1 Tax=Acanthaster planci TaxID=133434 RepID=A0A8B7XMT6_ACAPL|nr:uncharacterized protein LOC110974170 [Acanthaster planci]XP_022081291.1 uncharacterized protein LOC110974170 [Acanthaster planci]
MDKMQLGNGTLLVGLLLWAVCFVQLVSAGVVISELNADSLTRIDTREFIELYNSGDSQVSLADYVIVLYDGSTNAAYAVIPLQDRTLWPNTYFVIGSSFVSPVPDQTFSSSIDILQNGVDAVALYHGSSSLFTANMSVTADRLVDAVVYDNRGRDSSFLLDVLTPGQQVLDEMRQHLRREDESLSRCGGTDPLTLSQFRLTPITPGGPNNCTADETPIVMPTIPGGFPNLPSFPPDMANIYPDIAINEFSVDQGSGQFIELYDGGVGGIVLDGLIVVTYRGRNEASYRSPIVLDGQMTDENGYFLIGQASQQPQFELRWNLQTNRPPNAIALYFDDPSKFERNTPVTGVNLVDAVVYGDASNPEDSALVNILSPGRQPLVQPANQVNTSLSRCRSSERLRLEAFTSSIQTPGGDNMCTLPDIVINEVNVATENAQTNQFIEIFDGGIGQQPLDGIALVLYNGRTSLSYQAIDLTGYSTNVQGFCVVGWMNGTNVDIGLEFDVNVGFLQPGPDAIALHLSPPQRFRKGSFATNYNLIDAVVYGEGPALDLLHVLLPHQPILNEEGSSTSSGDRSISRCSCCQRLDSRSFGVGQASPGAINADCLQNNVTHVETIDHYMDLLRLNEIRIVQPGLPQGDFVELYDGGFGQIPLDNMVLVLYRTQGESSYRAIDLHNYQTDADGFFVIGPSSIQSSRLLISEIHWFDGNTGAVAIYKGSSADFPDGTLATSANLIDAVVYGDSNLLLLDLLTPGQSEVKYTVAAGETAILRCYSRNAFEVLAYAEGPPSPGMTNVCPPPPIVINEVNILDMSEAVGQYVELSSGGIPQFPLNDLLLFFWRGNPNRNPRLYNTVSIRSAHTDKNGFYLIGYRGLTSPRPDQTPFRVPTGKIREGSNGISLHRGLKSADHPKNSPPTTEGLVDVIIHGTDDAQTAQHLIEYFRPHAPRFQINEDASWSHRDESVNRCVDSQNNTVYQLAHITPKAPNHCPSRPDAGLIINELNLIPSEQFIELWDLGAGFTSLDDFVVVLYGEGDASYWTIPLTGFSTDSMGYFIMGTINVLPKAQFLFADGFMRHMYGAVALYRASTAASFPESGPPSSQGLIDAVVYTDLNSKPTGLTNVLTPSTASGFDSRTLQMSGFSLSRCLSPSLRSRRPFVLRPHTPRSLNDCPTYSNDVIINEVNVEHPGQATQEEFIELYDGGVGNVKMQYLSLVLFNGHYDDRSYATVDLHGKRTDLNGYFVIGAQDTERVNLKLRPRTSGGFLQDGPDAIALYRAPSGAFPQGTQATSRSLVDAIVYSTEDNSHISLVDKLLPGRSVVLEDANHATGDETINRCHGNQRLSPEVFSMGFPSPGRPNNCSRFSNSIYPDIVINEVNVEASGGAESAGEFIELTDKGRGMSSLDGFLLVLFNGANQDRSYWEMDLSGHRTNLNGFFVIGTSSVKPTPDILVPDDFIQNGPDAVVLYHTQARLFPRGTIATPLNMVDVIVYHTEASLTDDKTLLDKLAPGQRSVIEYSAYSDRDESLSRCLSNNSRTLSSFTVSQPTPGQPNICTGNPVIINEIKLDGDSVGFVELYDGGHGSTLLDSLSVKLYDSGGSGVRTYSVQSLNGKSTNGNGYFVYGKPSAEWNVDLEISTSDFLHSDVSSAVALYKDNDQTSAAVLLDAVVYGVENPSSMAVLDLLTPGQPQVQVSPDFGRGDASISRCACCVPLASVAFALTTPTPGQENRCLVGTSASTPSNVIISEVSPRNGGAESGEYVELRGPPGAHLDAFTLVLSSSSKTGPVYYYSLPLTRRVIPSDGIFVIGSGSVSPPVDALFPQSEEAVIRPGEGAVSIYRNSDSQFIQGTPVTSAGLVDAVVFTNVTEGSSSELSSILGFASIYARNFSAVADISAPSISRCACCNTQDPSAFTLSARTPGETNRCPRRAFKQTIQMHILDAAYEVWVTNPRFTDDLRRQIVAGVSAECKCSFNENYLKDEKLLNGSVYYQADMLALSKAHSKLLLDSYIHFVGKANQMNILGMDFHIDKKCFSDCLSGGGNSSKREKQKHQDVSAAVPVAVVIIVIVTIAVVAVMLYILYRRRQGGLSFMKNRGSGGDGSVAGDFRVTSSRALNDLDVLGTTSDNHNPTDFFANPVYMYEPPRAVTPQPGPPAKAEPKVESDRLAKDEGSSQANGESATVASGL